MFLLLIAAQLSSTNCIPNYSGGTMCTTLSTPPVQPPPIPESNQSGCGLCNLISILDSGAKQRHQKAVGQMLAKGDCVGAEHYALEKGDMDLADRVKDYCKADHQQPAVNPK